MKMRRICATPHLGEELLEKMGIFERTPEKKVETPRKKGEPKKVDIGSYNDHPIMSTRGRDAFLLDFMKYLI